MMDHFPEELLDLVPGHGTIVKKAQHGFTE
jgi:hypothetical protein